MSLRQFTVRVVQTNATGKRTLRRRPYRHAAEGLYRVPAVCCLHAVCVEGTVRVGRARERNFAALSTAVPPATRC
jgi:hypothetical protein